MGNHAENPPIEFVAARLHELRQAALVLSASPDTFPRRDNELRRVAASHDEWLLIAATQVGIDLDALDVPRSNLQPEVRCMLEFELTDAGWVLDR